MRKLSAFVAACAVAGCSLLVNLDELTSSGSNADATSGDASAPSDAGATTQDGFVAPPDDAGTTADVAPTRFCPQSGTLLCSDFDDTNIDAAVPGDWDFSFAPNGAIIGAVTAQAKSPPRSLLAETDPSTTSSVLVKTVSVKTGVTLSFDLYIDALGNNPSVAAIRTGDVELTVQPQATYSDVLESMSPVDAGAQYENTTGPTIPNPGWVHLDFDVDFSAFTADLSVNGKATIHRALSFTSSWKNTKSPTISIGIGNSSRERIYFDNVTIKTR
jgi:hypothetical protein